MKTTRRWNVPGWSQKQDRQSGKYSRTRNWNVRLNILYRYYVCSRFVVIEIKDKQLPFRWYFSNIWLRYRIHRSFLTAQIEDEALNKISQPFWMNDFCATFKFYAQSLALDLYRKNKFCFAVGEISIKAIYAWKYSKLTYLNHRIANDGWGGNREQGRFIVHGKFTLLQRMPNNKKLHRTGTADSFSEFRRDERSCSFYQFRPMLFQPGEQNVIPFLTLETIWTMTD